MQNIRIVKNNEEFENKEEKINIKAIKINLILPVVFCLSIVCISFINISNFHMSYKNSIKENEGNLQAGLASIEKKYATNFIGKKNYVTLNGAVAKLMGERELNGVLKLDNGHLTKVEQNKNLSGYVDTTRELNEYLKTKETPFLYVQAPHKVIDDNDKNLPAGHQTYVNRNADTLLDGFEKNDIQTLDLRDEIKKDNLNQYDLFYKTDHHWNVKGAFWAAEKVVSQIDKLLETETKIIGIDKYESRTEKLDFLGSNGERVGKLYGGSDNVEAYYPTFKTDFSMYIEEFDATRKGSFEEVIVYDHLSNYGKFLSGRYKFLEITNNLVNNDKEIMLIADSFSQALVPYLTPYYEHIHIVSTDKVEPVDMIKKIDEVDPDIVIGLYYGSNFSAHMPFVDEVARGYISSKK